jgi:methylamine---corrinoid protein Co-methyltransferase
MHTNRLPEIVNRSENGPFMKEAAYDMALARKTAELVKQNGIRFDPQVLVPRDDDMADRLYQAGLDLFVEMGVYNQSTECRILFTRQEVESAVGAAPNVVSLGCGKDAVIEKHRDVESVVPCRMHSGPTGTPCSESLHPLILQSCAQEPLVDCLGAGSVATYLGRLIVPGSPTEILASRKEATLAREAIRRAGRPGMHIEDVAVPLTCAGKIATIDRQVGLRPSDGLLVSQMPELKTNYDQLSRVAYLQSIGMHIVDLMTPLVGGLGGGAEGTAVVTVASHILGVLCYHVSYHFMGHMNLQWSHNTDRMGLWVQSMAGQALARNTPMVTVNDIYARSGLGTPEILWEVAAGAIVGAVSGLNQHGVGATCGTKMDHTSGVEARFQAQVAHATLGLTRQQANEYVLECLLHYERTLANPNPGKPFSELYNTDTLEPGQEWLDVYHQVCQQLTQLGLNIDGAWRKVRYDENPI